MLFVIGSLEGGIRDLLVDEDGDFVILTSKGVYKTALDGNTNYIGETPFDG